MGQTYGVPISAMAPTAASTGASLSRASSGLENLLNLAVNGYTSVLGAKSAATTAKTNLAAANQTGVQGNRVAEPAVAFGLSAKTLLIGAGIVAAGIVGVTLLRRAKG